MLDPTHLAPHAVARWAVATPETVAVHEIDGRQLTYAELHDDALRWAEALRRVGVGRGDHVGTMMPASVEAQLALLACGWLGAVEVPVNTAHRGQMLLYTLEHADVTTLIVAAEHLAVLAEVAAALPLLGTVIVVPSPSFWPGDVTSGRAISRPEPDGGGGTRQREPRFIGVAEMLDGVGPADDLPGPQVHDVAALLFTSGTTGPSKAVIAPWGLIHAIWSWVPDDAVMPGEGFYCSLPMFHNSGRSGFCNAMDRGATFIFRDKFSVTNFWSDVRSAGAVVAALVGPLTSLVYGAAPRHDDADNPLRGVILGPMIPNIVDFEERFGVRVATCYGQTECGCPITTGWDHGPWANCGRDRLTWPFNEVRLVDEYDNPVPAGTVGEMVVRSPEPWTMILGYYKMPEATVEAWRNGWFHTGDAFKADADGWYYFVDRLRDSIRRRGENISSFEVEAAVSGHPDVIECAAIGIRTEHGDDEVMAAVVVTDRATFDPAELVGWLEPRMPRYMMPRYIEAFDDLPRNQTTSRVRKNELRARGVTETTWVRPSPPGR